MALSIFFVFPRAATPPGVDFADNRLPAVGTVTCCTVTVWLPPGLPLVRLLGGVPRPIPGYDATGFEGPDGPARVAAEWAGRGFKGVKAKIGYPDAREDVDVVRAMRHAVGDGIALVAGPIVTHSYWLCRNCDWVRLVSRLAGVASY